MFTGETDIWEGIILFITPLVYTLLLQWCFSSINGVKGRTREISEALIGVIEAGDTNLDGHSIHVMDLTMLIYDYLPLAYQNQIKPENLRYAALLLDLGKLGIPSRILNKPGKLEEAEWDLMRRHPEIGVKVLKPVKSFEPISDWIMYHHERVDGGGYYHLKGNEIPLAARIIAVADTYSAIVMVRSYKPSRSYDDAMAALKIAAGTQLDKELVDIFSEIPREKVEKCTKQVKEKMEAFLNEDFRDDDVY
ncbi:MAG: HD domain-containing protein [Lachnospiraceae bacterium]|nr:HD domain-containing protein [Lachnospiraceae bacterium]